MPEANTSRNGSSAATSETDVPAILTNIVEVFVFRRQADCVEVLLLKRRPQSRVGNTWQTVQGRIEDGETAWRAGLRELAEETGLTPTAFWQLQFVHTFYVAREDAIRMCPCFAAEVPPAAGVTLSHEHTDFRWLPLEEAAREILWPGQRRAIAELHDEILAKRTCEPFLRIDATSRDAD